MSSPDLTTSQPLISVIIPAFNSESYLRDAIDSALLQNIHNLEVIVIDDGSSDKSYELAKSYGKPVRAFRQENQGVAVARNYGVSMSEAEWIAFLDADDIWLPGKLDEQFKAIGDHVWSHTDNYLFGDKYDDPRKSSELETKYGGMILEKLLVNNMIGTSSVILKRCVFNQEGGFNAHLFALEDWDLWLRIAARYPISYVDKPLDNYRVHDASLSYNYRETMRYHLDLIAKVFSEDGVGHTYSHLKKKALTSSYSVNSYIAEAANDFNYSFYLAMLSIRHDPLSITRWRRFIGTLIKRFTYTR